MFTRNGGELRPPMPPERPTLQRSRQPSSELTETAGTSATAYPKYSRPVLHFSTLYTINAELRLYHMIGFRWEGENQFGSGLRQHTCGLRIIDARSRSGIRSI